MVIAAMMLGAAIAASAPPARCADPLTESALTKLANTPVRDVDTRDLLTLRSFGPQGAGDEDEAPFSISPDQRQAALLLRRADPDTNGFCQSLIVVDLRTGQSRVVDRGGALIRPIAAWGNVLAGFPFGLPAVITPAWAPDGRSIAYLKNVDGHAQVWVVPLNGGIARPVTRERQDVSAVVWSGAKRILFRTDRMLTRAEAAVDEEGLTGWHYDDRVFPPNRAKPFPAPSDPATLDHALDLDSGSVTDATPEERETLAMAGSASLHHRWSGNGTTALRTVPFDGALFPPPHALELIENGHTFRCAEPACRDSHAQWLEQAGHGVLILARSGWDNSEQTFYRWDPEDAKVDRLATTTAVLIGCRPLGREMVCARETSTEPRRLVVVDPRSGRMRTIFNPNPDYDRLRVGKVERIDVASAHGSQAFADIMLPNGFVAGRHYPMVVVNYESRGFLSGGTNNEFPIPALASAGMIVLSFNRPRDFSSTITPPPKNFVDNIRLDTANWADRRNVHSALMAAIDKLIGRDIVDARRIGITGLSDGLATAAFGLLNSDHFSVAALGGCCEEPVEAEALEGPWFSRQVIAGSYPPLNKPDPAFWHDYSLAQNAERVHAPILIQAADAEYIQALPTYEALREAGVPVDLYVFPGEQHSKWQPAHRLAVWDRTLRWFAFWFDLASVPGQSSPPPDELERWTTWRKQWRPVAAP